ncbi:hypothetical protein [Mesorhizobium sp. B2-3-5]|uniref:hypothetical protein n=1 Tax=Mesorhizobium sp. B2-3-5 TaxID=2589958 RepID=UPI00112EBE5D|nr:hypothetical protein [Mesorhizobium sp. B2-3-5]TPM12570.1 hypothetical protein FJ958_31360 [Mesorhizobium sp. B2-3-5]
MSLDFSVLNANGSPERSVSLGVELHHQLLTVAKSQGLDEILRFDDYYEDAEVPCDKIPNLMRQISVLSGATTSSELRTFLEKLTELGGFALSNRRTIIAISD